LVLIAQAVFLLERGQTDRQTRLNALPMPMAVQPAWVIMHLTVACLGQAVTVSLWISY